VSEEEKEKEIVLWVTIHETLKASAGGNRILDECAEERSEPSG
jgi:hypothetical protein